MFKRLANRMILQSSREEIPVPHKESRLLSVENRNVEIFVERHRCQRTDDAQLFVLKCGGAASRAERATIHPLDLWEDVPAEIWSINYPGFGRSDGTANLASLPAVGRFVYQRIFAAAAGRPLLVTGNSLGTTLALHLAARYGSMHGLLLRNPPPLRQLIMGRFGWKSFWLGAAMIARQMPHQLDSLENAAWVNVPAVFVMSGKDRTVPPRFQRKIFDAYAGPKQVFHLAEAGHATVMSPSEINAYRGELEWLRQQILKPESILVSRD